MTQTKHTPTPWYSNDDYADIRDHRANLIMRKPSTKTSIYADIETAKANAAFIVKAVNSHEALVVALQACMERICEVDKEYEAEHSPAFLKGVEALKQAGGK